jgi:hypothetical protein
MKNIPTKKEIFEQNQFPKLESILEIINSNIIDLNYKIDYKYGEFGHSYFIKKIKEVIDKDQLLFEDTVEGMFNDLESEEKSPKIVEYSQLIQDQLEDKVLQRVILLKSDLEELNKRKNELEKFRFPTQEQSNDLSEVNKEIYYIKQELDDKTTVMSLRSTNYYENKRMYAQTGEIDKKEVDNVSR